MKKIEFQSVAPNLMVANVNKTIEYYTKILGFELGQCVPETGERVWAMLKRGSVMLMFQSRESLERDLGTSFNGVPTGGTLSFYIKMEGINRFFEEIRDEVELIKPLGVSFYGATEFVMKDLDGYYLMFSEFPKE